MIIHLVIIIMQCC